MLSSMHINATCFSLLCTSCAFNTWSEQEWWDMIQLPPVRLLPRRKLPWPGQRPAWSPVPSSALWMSSKSGFRWGLPSFHWAKGLLSFEIVILYTVMNWKHKHEHIQLPSTSDLYKQQYRAYNMSHVFLWNFITTPKSTAAQLSWKKFKTAHWLHLLVCI